MVFTYEYVSIGDIFMDFISSVIDVLFSVPISVDDFTLWFVCTLVLCITLRAAKRNDQLKNKYK